MGDINRDNFSEEPGVWARCQNGRHAVRKDKIEGIECTLLFQKNWAWREEEKNGVRRQNPGAEF